MNFRQIIKIDYVIEPVYFKNYSEMVLQMMESDICMLCRLNYIPGLDQDDLAQELRFELWKKLSKYNSNIASIRTWAIKILKNKIIDLWRYSQRDNRIVLNDLITCSTEKLAELEDSD